MKIVERPSPNHDSREGQAIDMLLLHYTGMPSGEAALERLCDPNAEPGRVSAHYCIEEDGTIYRLVPEERRAWHAGVSSWSGESNINARSIGIELVNPGHEFGYRPFPEAQMLSLIELSQEILNRNTIRPDRVLGHSDVAPLRKEDPGELFDWARLAAAGIGLWPMGEGPARSADRAHEFPEIKTPEITIPDIENPETETSETAELQKRLARYGYAVPQHGALDDETRAVICAFQRHFLPDRLSGSPDAATFAQITRLLALTGA